MSLVIAAAYFDTEEDKKERQRDRKDTNMQMKTQNCVINKIKIEKIIPQKDREAIYIVKQDMMKRKR